MDGDVREGVTKGTEDLWKRLRDVVSHMVDRLNEPDSRFHATLVTNIHDLVSLLPQLNVNQDPDLERFATQIRARLCNYLRPTKLTLLRRGRRWMIADLERPNL